MQWLTFSDSPKVELRGLYWAKENQPQLWRLPKAKCDTLPRGVKARCKAPSGGRIVLRCDSSCLGLRVETAEKPSKDGFDLYVDGVYTTSALAGKATSETQLMLVQGLERRQREFVIYLPLHQDVVVRGVGVDAGTSFSAEKKSYARRLPVVFYGSSVCQGTGSAKSGMSYEAQLCRELNLDFVNLGFGGAGKAEPNVVELVNSIPACCYVLDLGKSYGMQDKGAFLQMLKTLRASHPEVPILCLTPITSAVEVKSEEYAKRSLHTRVVMREAAQELIKAGDKRLYLVEGEQLLGFGDHKGLSKDGVHPSETGYTVIANRLKPKVKEALGL